MPTCNRCGTPLVFPEILTAAHVDFWCISCRQKIRLVFDSYETRDQAVREAQYQSVSDAEKGEVTKQNPVAVAFGCLTLLSAVIAVGYVLIRWLFF